MTPPFLILLISFFVATAMSVILFIIAQTYPRTIHGLREWSGAALAITLAFPLFLARGHIPDLFSIVLANLLLLAAFMVMNLGTRKFAGLPPRYGREWLFLFVFSYIALFVWFTYVRPDIEMRVATMVLFTMIAILDQLLLVLRRLPRTAGRHVLVFLLTVLVGLRASRLVTQLLGMDPPISFFGTSVAQLAYYATPALTIPLGAISYIMLASEKLRHDLEFINRHDGLTGCLNKNAAIEELEREIAHARRHGNTLSIMFIDLDNFKDINDTHGHIEGDRVLVDFATRTKATLRGADQLTRFGGDEFMAILPDTNPEQALLVANRLHATGASGQPVPWSVSIGVSSWQGQDDSLNALLTRRTRRSTSRSRLAGIRRMPSRRAAID